MLSISGLSKCYKDKHALENVSFDLDRGEIVALLGANGSGKTTTVQSICKLIEYDEGTITLDGEPTHSSNAYLQKVGAVLGGSRNINWRLTAKQNADYFARLRGFSGTKIHQNINELHSALGLDEHSKKEVMKLSTGNKQKAALLCALSYTPDFVLLDEPTLGLDFQTVDDLQAIIKQCANKQNQGLLITSHDLAFIENICSRVIVLHQGKLLFKGDVSALKSKMYKYRLSLQLNDRQQFPLASMQSLWDGRFAITENPETQIVDVHFETSEQSLKFIHHIHEQKISIAELKIAPLSVDEAYQALVKSEKQ